MTKINIKKSGTDDGTNALERAIKGSEPYPTPPHTKDGSINLVVTAKDGTITVDEQ